MVASQWDFISLFVCMQAGSLPRWMRHSQHSTHIKYIDSDIMIVNNLLAPLSFFLVVVWKSVTQHPRREPRDMSGQGRPLHAHSSLARDHMVHWLNVLHARRICSRDSMTSHSLHWAQSSQVGM